MYVACLRYKCQKNVIVCATTCRYSKRCKTFKSADTAEVEKAVETYLATHPNAQMGDSRNVSSRPVTPGVADPADEKRPQTTTRDAAPLVSGRPTGGNAHGHRKKKGKEKVAPNTDPKTKRAAGSRSKPKFIILHGDQYQLTTDKQLLDTIQAYLFEKKVPLKELTVYKLGAEVEVNLSVSVKQKR